MTQQAAKKTTATNAKISNKISLNISGTHNTNIQKSDSCYNNAEKDILNLLIDDNDAALLMSMDKCLGNDLDDGDIFLHMVEDLAATRFYGSGDNTNSSRLFCIPLIGLTNTHSPAHQAIEESERAFVISELKKSGLLSEEASVFLHPKLFSHQDLQQVPTHVFQAHQHFFDSEQGIRIPDELFSNHQELSDSNQYSPNLSVRFLVGMVTGNYVEFPNEIFSELDDDTDQEEISLMDKNIESFEIAISKQFTHYFYKGSGAIASAPSSFFDSIISATNELCQASLDFMIRKIKLDFSIPTKDLELIIEMEAEESFFHIGVGITDQDPIDKITLPLPGMKSSSTQDMISALQDMAYEYGLGGFVFSAHGESTLYKNPNPDDDLSDNDEMAEFNNVIPINKILH